LIIKNSASDNTIDYAFAANNRYGPIVDISAAVRQRKWKSLLTRAGHSPLANFPTKKILKS